VGRLVSLEACPVCNYNVEGMLHVGWSTRSQLFMAHRYDLAVCRDCHNVVSVLLPIPDYDVPLVSRAAESDLKELEDRAARGDPFARVLLPIHRHALEAGEAAPDAEIGVCTVCSSRNLKLYTQVGGDEGEHFDDGTAWLDCPRCAEGRLWAHTTGSWDEIDDAP